MVKFFLHFAVGTGVNPTYTRHEIAEPIGFDAAEWVLRQEPGRYGRDVLFSPDNFQFSSTVDYMGLTHLFPELIQTYQARGFEGNVLFEIEIDGAQYILGQLDFSKAETDGVKYFTCGIIQLNDEVIMKRRADVKVNLLSNEDYNGLPIDPLTLQKVLIKALPLSQVSEWVQAGNTTGYQVPSNSAISINFSPAITKSEIEDTLSPELNPIFGNANNGRDSFNLIEANNNLTDNVLSLEGGNWTTPDKVGAGLTLWYAIGNDFATATPEILQALPFTATDYTNSWTIPPMNRGDKLWVWFRYLNPSDGLFAVCDFNAANFRFETTSISLDSLTDGVRLIDAMKQVVKSISGLTVDAPRFDVGGEHYDQYIFKGNQIRLIQDKPFTLSFTELLDYLPEVNCDYQVNSDGTVFIGHEADFYVNESAGLFQTPPGVDYREYTNDRLTYNTISYKYDKFEDGKNELQKDALRGVSTHFDMANPNRFVEDELDIKVNFIRDAYLLEKVRKDSIIVTEDAPTEEDEDVFILDVIQAAGTISQSEKVFVNHILKGGLNLDLINNNSFNWELIGFYPTQGVSITGENQGSYQVTAVTPNILSLTKTASPNPDFTGVSLTQLGWNLQTNLVNRTSEGFSSITLDGENIEGFANLKYAPKRNLQKYYRGQIKAASQFYPGEEIRNTFYRNGGDVVAVFSDEVPFTQGRQRRDLQINNLGLPILSAFKLDTQVICSFAEFWAALQSIREEKKYIECQNTNDNLIKLHPIEMAYSMKNGILTITGEKRWE